MIAKYLVYMKKPDLKQKFAAVVPVLMGIALEV